MSVRRAAPASEAELDDALSEPTPDVIAALVQAPGDVLVLGAGGKIGPGITRMAKRAAAELGDGRQVIAVSRFTNDKVRRQLEEHGIQTIAADLRDRDAINGLPDVPNVIFLAGQKFGTSVSPAATWAMNVYVPMLAAERYAGSRFVAFSTGNVYPLVPIEAGGARESDTPAPVGEYAQSALGRERIVEYITARDQTGCAIVRLNYAIALRYGVLTDLALAIVQNQPISLAMGHVNVIWQGDSNAIALRCLAHVSQPPLVVNVTGPETLSVRDAARSLGRSLGKEPIFTGEEAPDALLSNTALMRKLYGSPMVSTDRLIEWTAEWVSRGGDVLGRPTHFGSRDGSF